MSSYSWSLVPGMAVLQVRVPASISLMSFSFCGPSPKIFHGYQPIGGVRARPSSRARMPGADDCAPEKSESIRAGISRDGTKAEYEKSSPHVAIAIISHIFFTIHLHYLDSANSTGRNLRRPNPRFLRRASREG